MTLCCLEGWKAKTGHVSPSCGSWLRQMFGKTPLEEPWVYLSEAGLARPCHEHTPKCQFGCSITWLYSLHAFNFRTLCMGIYCHIGFLVGSHGKTMYKLQDVSFISVVESCLPYDPMDFIKIPLRSPKTKSVQELHLSYLGRRTTHYNNLPVKTGETWIVARSCAVSKLHQGKTPM